MVGAWIVTILSIAYVAVAGFFTLIPTNDTVSSSHLSRFTYELTQFLPIILVLLVAGLFYVLGQREMRQTRAVPEEINVPVNVQGQEGD